MYVTHYGIYLGETIIELLGTLLTPLICVAKSRINTYIAV